jgi:tetratricopeptide (TPR) repeat protein
MRPRFEPVSQVIPAKKDCGFYRAIVLYFHFDAAQGKTGFFKNIAKERNDSVNMKKCHWVWILAAGMLFSSVGRTAGEPGWKDWYTRSLSLYRRGDYQKAAAAAQKALEAAQDQPEAELTCTRQLASIYRMEGRGKDALPLFRKCLEMSRGIFGEESAEASKSLKEMGMFYEMQGQHAEAEQVYREALSIDEKSGEADSSGVPLAAWVLGKLVVLDLQQEKYSQAEQDISRQLEMTEKALGSEHRKVADLLDKQASIFMRREKYDGAEAILKRSLEIREEMFGGKSPFLIESLEKLSELYKKSGNEQALDKVDRRLDSIR